MSLSYNLKDIINQAYFILLSWLSSCYIIFNIADIHLLLQLSSIRAGGVGVNLQAADTVILFDTDWNPQAMQFLFYDFHCKLFTFFLINYDLFVGIFSGRFASPGQGS